MDTYSNPNPQHQHTISTNNVGIVPETPEKTFTQAELEKIIGERLHRERSKFESEIQEYKETLNELDDFGYTGTPAEKREAIRAYKAELSKAQEIETLQHEAKETGTSPEVLAEIKELKKELAAIKGERHAKEAEIKAKIEAEESWNKQFNEFKEAFPDVDEAKLNENQKFLKFVKNKSGTLKELYEDFIELVGETEANAVAKAIARNERSTGSGKSSSADGGGYGLSDSQKNLAQRAGLTYKEYSEYLKQIT